jgi:Leu/Phe-tRNA-protein transferase
VLQLPEITQFIIGQPLRRARQLFEDGDCHAIAVHDETGSILTGVLLQLKLGAAFVG